MSIERSFETLTEFLHSLESERMVTVEHIVGCLDENPEIEIAIKLVFAKAGPEMSLVIFSNFMEKNGFNRVLAAAILDAWTEIRKKDEESIKTVHHHWILEMLTQKGPHNRAHYNSDYFYQFIRILNQNLLSSNL